MSLKYNFILCSIFYCCSTQIKAKSLEDTKAFADVLELKNSKIIKKIALNTATEEEYDECLAAFQSSTKKLNTVLEIFLNASNQELEMFLFNTFNLDLLKEKLLRKVATLAQKTAKEIEQYKTIKNEVGFSALFECVKNMHDFTTNVKNNISQFLVNTFNNNYKAAQSLESAKKKYREAYAEYTALSNHSSRAGLTKTAIFLMIYLDQEFFFTMTNDELRLKIFKDRAKLLTRASQ